MFELNTHIASSSIFDISLKARVQARLQHLHDRGTIPVQIAIVRNAGDLAFLAGPFGAALEDLLGCQADSENCLVMSRSPGQITEATIYASEGRHACVLIIDERDPELAALVDAIENSKASSPAQVN